MIKRFLLSTVLFLLPMFAYADWAADRDASAGYVTVTTLATAVDEAVPFCVVYLSDLSADFHTAMSTASDTDGKTIRVSTSDGVTQLACVPIGVNTGTDTGCLIFLGTGMSASVDVDYRIYVGNASLTMPAASAGEQLVFAAYAGVYFPGVDTRDWTSGGRTLTAVNTPGTAASGLEGITAAEYASASSQHHQYSGTQAVTNWPLTIEALAYTTVNNVTDEIAGLFNTASAATQNVASIRFSGTVGGDPVAAYFDGASGSGSQPNTSTGFSTSTLHYVAGNRDANTGTGLIYIDGGSSGSNTTTITTPSFNSFSLGGGTYSGGGSFLEGRVAVALLSSSVRSADYAATMHDNWAGTMYTAGAWTALGSCNTGSTGWVLFTAVAQSTSADMNWTDPANSIIDDSTYAWADLESGVVDNSEYLNLTNIDFDTSTIPVGADSYTVQVRIKKYRGTGASDEINDLTVQFIDETGTRIGDNKADTATDWPTTASTFDYTITGHVFDGTEFDADSGLAFRATGNAGASISQARFVTGWMKVDWTCPSTIETASGFFGLED